MTYTASIPLPFMDPPLTKNTVRRMHFRVEARIRKDHLQNVRWAIRAARVKPIEQAVVVLHWQMPDQSRRDGDGAAPTLALCIDALVQEKVLPDDSWRYIIHSGITCHAPVKGAPGRLWLTISEATTN